MSLQKTYEFNQIVADILTHPEFLKLQHELHHGISRFEHCMRVAKTAYKMSKKLGMDYERVTRAALLHDFYTDEDTKKYNAKETLKAHPEIALENAKTYFDLDKVQENIIETHMFPITKKYIEREYTIANNHLMVTSEHSAEEIEKKAKKVMNMLKKGIKFTPTQPDINAIIEKLLKEI